MKRWSRVVVLALALVALAVVPTSAASDDTQAHQEEVSALVAPVSAAELAVAPFNVLTVTTMQATTVADVGQAPENPSVATQELVEEQDAQLDSVARGASSSGSARSSRYTSGEYDVLKEPHARGT